MANTYDGLEPYNWGTKGDGTTSPTTATGANAGQSTAAAAMIPWPGDSREAAESYDRPIIAGEKWPGVTSITGDGLVRNIEEVKAKGNDGATLKDNGDALQKIKLSTFIWTAEQWAEFQRLFYLVKPNRDGGPRSPISIYAPQLELYGIRNIYVAKMPIFTQDKRKKTMTIEMEATRWAPAPAPVSKGAGVNAYEGLPDDVKELIAQVKDINAGVIQAAKDAKWSDNPNSQDHYGTPSENAASSEGPADWMNGR